MRARTIEASSGSRRSEVPIDESTNDFICSLSPPRGNSLEAQYLTAMVTIRESGDVEQLIHTHLSGKPP